MTLLEAIGLARIKFETQNFEDIQKDVATSWAGLAVEAYGNYLKSGSNTWLSIAIDCHHEALEHASDATPGTLETLRGPLTEAARAAGVDR